VGADVAAATCDKNFWHGTKVMPAYEPQQALAILKSVLSY
jgi:hypothetical protein